MNKRIKKGFLNEILRSRRTVFSFKELMLSWGGIDGKTARARVHYYVKNNDLYHLRRGLYAKDMHYDKFELATRIFTPSYVSFETVLGAGGIIFQHYNRIFVASYQSKEIVCDNQTFSFKTIKIPVLTNPAGIENREFYSIASPERAFLDVVYLHKDYHFDNLSPLNWDKVYGILPAYGGNRLMEDRVKKYHEAFRKNR
ncbi:MAG: hypothetical protein ABSF80_11735 [Chitinispirillaceae bacterium]|jgi:hypothetical protein